jgi:hypothetical protein
MCVPKRRGILRPVSNSQKTMRCLTSSEIHKWLAGQGMHHQPHAAGVPEAGDFPLPAERRSRLQLANSLADLLAKDGNKLLEIIPTPQRLSDEWEQIACFRTELDEARSAIAAPGHLFKSGDRADFRRMLAMLLGFRTGWTFYIYSAPSHTTLLIDEDRMAIWSAKKGLRNELGRQLMARHAA